VDETRKNKNSRDILDGDFSKLDKANMIELLEEFPQKMRDALRLGEEFTIPTDLSVYPPQDDHQNTTYNNTCNFKHHSGFKHINLFSSIISFIYFLSLFSSYFSILSVFSVFDLFSAQSNYLNTTITS